MTLIVNVYHEWQEIYPHMWTMRMEEEEKCFTINNESSRAAASFGHHITSHTGVVRRVRESGLFDDQIVIDCDQEIGVLRRIYDVLIL